MSDQNPSEPPLDDAAHAPAPAATPAPMPPIAPEAILEKAEHAYGDSLKITPRERAPLLSQVRGLIASAEHNTGKPLLELTRAELKQALCQVRRRHWTAQLNAIVEGDMEVWVRKPDIQQAVALVTDPNINAEHLRDVLQGVLEERWRSMGSTPAQVLEEVRTELADSGVTLSGAQLANLSASVAEAFGVQDQNLTRELVEAEEKRQKEQAEIRARAEERRAQELERLKQWEDTLVDFEEVPAILRCSRRDALRWIAENRLPVARRVTDEDGRETFYFEPSELKKCRQLIPYWRRGESGPPEGALEKAPLPTLEPATPQGNEAIARVAALDKFAGHFRTARALKRRITLVTGPTNSGKSHTALETLAGAESGVALAPLRLLAHEFRESLVNRGVPTSLTTGEERIIDPTAKHVAATVEMCPFNRPVDVAIIDEAQMLSDSDRGAAWTAAIMGVPARQIFVLGAADCIPQVKRIAELCGDEVEEIHLERKSPLKAGGTLALKELKAGDALIAFSRREVLDLRAQLMAQGRKVAVIYGALSPEVRRAEAARFNSGEADILIATDAIGMGLNLSIKRVVFSALQKFDGRENRNLTTQEIKQIGGRAGRYGKHEEGLVCVLEGAGSPTVVRRALEAAPEVETELRPLVQPDADIVDAVAGEVGTDSLYGVLARIKRAVLRPDDPNYRLADMEQAMEIAAELEGVEDLDLNTRWTYAMCPVNTRDNGVARLVEWAAQHARGQQVPPPGTGRLPPAAQSSNEELERAEKRHRLLVTWRWLAMRFPEIYADLETAERNAATLDDWIEQVLRTQSRMRETTRRQSRHPGRRGGRDGGSGPGGDGKPPKRATRRTATARSSRRRPQA
ncbi:RNA helicase [Oecophyllibacter saccharovorans]|uniref:RNA helicase n=2 Tax=Oecophyllibacter saccharovorans TaxID=2558360 RepID=A0A506UMC9_9PROT|nr:RNA helicase [Oecophyllibacter saccharovorans]